MSNEAIVFATEAEMPPLPVSIGTTLVNKTGTWRYIRPFYDNKTPPCNDACPAGEDIVGYLSLLKEGRYEEAWRLLTQENPFPGVCGRVCPHPCEQACNRTELGGAIAIHAMERFLADEAAARGLHFPVPTAEVRQRMSEYRVAIIGAGPAGLSCAYHLARLGYPVTVYEALPKPGGMMRLIPPYRLPAVVLDREIANIEAIGVRIITGQRLGDNLSWEMLQGYQAIFIAIGQTRSRKLGIPGEEVAGVLSGIEFLAMVEQHKDIHLGQVVAVIGGGNTALDAARTARRMGAEVTILYRRSRSEMPAASAEIAEAEEEGVTICYLVSPVRILSENGHVTGLECVRMALGEPDDSGRRRPLPMPGSEYQITADTVISALGQEAELDLLMSGIQAERGRILTDPAAATTWRGIFAGGDVTTGYGTVMHAVGSGKRAALAIDRYLSGQSLEGFPPLDRAVHTSSARAIARSVNPAVVHLENLNQDRLEYVERPVEPQLDVAARGRSFEEVNLCFDQAAARREAERCFSCGTCNGCDVCFLHCPDVAIKHTVSGQDNQGRYILDYDYCKGCGICVVECPRQAMSIERETQCAQT